MNILDIMKNIYIMDIEEDCSNTEEIEQLKKFSSIEIPEEYIELIQKEGIEIELDINKESYLRIWGALGCIEMNEIYYIQTYIPNSLAIADDGGGGVLIYLNGKNGFGLYYNRLADLDIKESIFISYSLFDLLVKNIGLDIYIEVS